MKTQQEIEEMKNMIDKKIVYQIGRLGEAKNMLAYDTINSEIKQLMAQYNILLEVLK